MIKLSNELIYAIYEELVEPFYDAIYADASTKAFIADKEKLAYLKIRQSKFVYKFFVKEEEGFDEEIKKAALIHKEMGLPLELAFRFLLLYTELMTKLLLKHEKAFADLYGMLNKLEYLSKSFVLIHEEVYSVDHNSQTEEDFDDFFDFDAEEIDETINNMHYEEKEKITAIDYMALGEFEVDDIHDLEEEIDQYIEILESMDMELILLRGVDTFDRCARMFDMSIEFKDLAVALMDLSLLLRDLDMERVSQELLLAYLESVMGDLKSWVFEVLVDQSARDIHYLDASLFANVAQIKIMMESVEGGMEEEEDALEFF